MVEVFARIVSVLLEAYRHYHQLQVALYVEMPFLMLENSVTLELFVISALAFQGRCPRKVHLVQVGFTVIQSLTFLGCGNNVLDFGEQCESNILFYRSS